MTDVGHPFVRGKYGAVINVDRSFVREKYGSVTDDGYSLAV